LKSTKLITIKKGEMLLLTNNKWETLSEMFLGNSYGTFNKIESTPIYFLSVTIIIIIFYFSKVLEIKIQLFLIFITPNSEY